MAARNGARTSAKGVGLAMAGRLNFESHYWTDPRRSRLMGLLGSEALADGSVVKMWLLAQEYWGRGRQLIPQEVFGLLEASDKLLEAKLAEVQQNGVYVKGAREHFDWLHLRREAARKGGKKEKKPRKKADARNSENSSNWEKQSESKSKQSEPSCSLSPSVSVSESASVIEIHETSFRDNNSKAAWDAYSEAYRLKYGSDPVRNVTTNSQMKRFVQRIGAESPEVLQFYLRHRNSFYATKMHALGVALSDAEKLRTEWATGRMQTASKAHQDDKTATAAQLLLDVREGRA